MTKTYLCHWGIKDMKWGIRRYRNPDGTLTEAGKARYRQNPDGSYTRLSKNNITESESASLAKQLGREKTVDASDDDAKDLQVLRGVTNDVSSGSRSLGNIVRRHGRISAEKKAKNVDVSTMSDDELRKKINRIQMENTYRALNTPEMSKGHKIVANILDDVSDVAAVAGVAFGLGIAYKKLMG